MPISETPHARQAIYDCPTHGEVEERDVCVMPDGTAWCHTGGGCGETVQISCLTPPLENPAIQTIVQWEQALRAVRRETTRAAEEWPIDLDALIERIAGIVEEALNDTPSDSS